MGNWLSISDNQLWAIFWTLAASVITILVLSIYKYNADEAKSERDLVIEMASKGFTQVRRSSCESNKCYSDLVWVKTEKGN